MSHAKTAKASSVAPLSDKQKRLVKESFALVEPIAEQAAGLFYGKLFELDPKLKPLFKGNMEEQGRKLMSTLKLVIGSLDRLQDIMPAVKLLGTKHRGYGVKESDYDTVAAALLWTLAAGLKDAFTPEVKDAWTAVYGVLASVMKAA